MPDTEYYLTLTDQDLDAALIREAPDSPAGAQRLAAARVRAAQANAAAAASLAEAIDRLAVAITDATDRSSGRPGAR